MDDSDRLRFVHSLFIFNDKRATPDNHRQKDFFMKANERDLLVRLHAWCLMNNHYHLLVSPINNDIANLSLFIKKLNGGYAKYFNEKHERSGALWQGKSKKINVTSDTHFQHIPFYIHLNPLDFKYYEWRKGQVKDQTRAVNFLNRYRWSSHLDYSGKRNFPSVIQQETLNEVLGDGYLRKVASIITDPEIAFFSESIERA